MMKFFQFVIAEKTADSFKNDSRLFITKRVIEELKKEGISYEEKKVFLKKYLGGGNQDELIRKAEIQNEEDLYQTITPLIQQQALESETKNRALLSVQKKIEQNTEFRRVEKRPDRIDENDAFFSEESDQESHYNEPFFNYKYKKSSLKDHVNPFVTLKREDFDNQAIYRQVKKNYYINKKKYYEENIYTDENKKRDDNQNNLQVTDFLINSQENLKPEDYLWKNLQENFQRIFPTNILEAQKGQQILNQQDDLAHEPYEYDVQEILELSQLKQESDQKGIKHLNEDHQMELEIYVRQNQDPFFRHYIQNDIKYFIDRIQEGAFDVMSGLMPSSKSNDLVQYYDADRENLCPEILEDESLRLQYEALKKEKISKLRIFNSGKRKTSTCLVMITEGPGIVLVNGKKIFNYFCHPYHRNIALRPLFLSPSSHCQYNINFYVRGGGVTGQSNACQVALARALGQLNPCLRPIFMKLDLLRTDYRQKERKKTGKYKARKSYTYVRR
ncbi:hypothetical protein IMG5_087880 [Ichthyophthirius multifiliis]|uniref:Ribosomal protein S9 n=1 Tax=Ichthyophthirius multifiliis TaxID=5932 RepID=G0QR24_ICHMU|nr:hypothetical protein IMG5_087880 [Ichthyophthirius multifiliis]EGR32325.1 hypothetical protein IMG5_087880 [Ichthyophthirius multifiliis]|eukprot:XP_004035811.1 hypothetical protein IMG5_087880 [Ichthyophthirius multifiliis]